MMATFWILPITMLSALMVLLLPQSVMGQGGIASNDLVHDTQVGASLQRKRELDHGARPIYKPVIPVIKLCADTADDFKLKRKTKSCDFIQGKSKKKRKKLCKKKKVANACPRTCNLCVLTKCPKKSGSKKFKIVPSCSDNLKCNYDYIFTGCNWDEIRCSAPQTLKFCDSGVWETLTLKKPQPICSPDEEVSEGFPFGEACKPCPKVKPAGKACPKDAPVNQSDCSKYKKRLDGRRCKYDFRYTGCNLDEVKERGCTPFRSFECTEEKKWQESVADPKPCGLELAPPVKPVC